MQLPFIFLSTLKQRRLFILITSIILLLILIMQIINRRFWMHDFEVYYKASQAFASGSKIYGLTFGLDSGYYKYSPFALYLFLPISLLPFGAAKIVFFLLISAALITTLILSAQLLQYSLQSIKTISNGMLFIVMGIVSSVVFRELHLGNVNVILLLLSLIMLWFLLSGKQITAGILFAFVLFIKPHFIILAPLLLFRKQYKSIAITLLGLTIGCLLPALVTGISENMVLHKEWLQTMQDHNKSLWQAYDTIYSLFLHILLYIQKFNIQFYDKAVELTLLIIVAAAFGWFVIGNIKRERKIQPQHIGRSFTIEFMILIALIPNLVITDTEHFLLSIPLILFLLGLMRIKTPLWFKITVVIALILFSMNIYDLIGTKLSLWLTHNGILGLGNLMLIGLTMYGYRNFELKGIMPESKFRQLSEEQS